MTRLPLLLALALTACDSAIVDQGEPGERGERGPQGAAGRAGARGPRGEAWKPATYVVEASADVPENADPQGTVVQVFCDLGDLAMNGGCQWGDLRGDHMAEVRAYLAGPIGQAAGEDTFNGWQCHGIGTGEETAIYVVATCLDMSD